MKKRVWFVSAGFCFGLLCVGSPDAAAGNLTVGRGETLELQKDETYETVTVSGTLNIPSGIKLTAMTLELGPNTGDAAVVNVQGSASGSLSVKQVNVGMSGGSGRIVALSTVVHNTGWDEVLVVKLGNVLISANAAVSESGYIDFLQLGAGTADFTTMSNESSVRARILVKNGCLGFGQNWGKPMFVGLFQVESQDGGNIRFGCAYGQRYLHSAATGDLIIKGNGHDVYFCRYASSDDQFFILNQGIVWMDVKNVEVVENHLINVTANDLLPYGPSSGGLSLSTGLASSLQIGATVQHLNSFSSSLSVSSVSLSGSVGSKVIFGEGNTDGSLKGRVADAVGVFKVGTGTFSIADPAQVGALTISNGTVRITTSFALTDLTVESGATLEIDGVTVAPSSGRALVRGEVLLKNGGRLMTSCMVAEDERVADYYNAGEWSKDGEGTLILENPISMPSNVHVKSGTLAFTSAGYSCKLYKWNVTGWSSVGYIDSVNGADGKRFYLGELAFVDENGKRVGKGMSGKAAGTAPADLTPGTVAYADANYTVISAGGSGGISSLFDANQWPRTGLTSPLPSDEGGVTLYVRLKGEGNPVVAYDFGMAYGGAPKCWTMSGSVDNGATWEVLNSVENFVAGDHGGKWYGANSSNFGDVVPKEFPFYSANLEFANAGVKNMPKTMSVEVDAGATADFTNVTGGQVLDEITVNFVTGGGTIKNAKLADVGTIYLTNVPEGKKIAGTSVALGLDAGETIVHLENWKVAVNGIVLPNGKITAKMSGGRLLFFGPGLLLIVQ